MSDARIQRIIDDLLNKRGLVGGGKSVIYLLRGSIGGINDTILNVTSTPSTGTSTSRQYDKRIIIPFTGKFTLMDVEVQSVQGAGNSFDLILQVGAVDSGMTVTMGDTNVREQSTVEAPVTKGDFVYVRCANLVSSAGKATMCWLLLEE
jgi:hypothetical protein